jgi:hypothetical protein
MSRLDAPSLARRLTILLAAAGIGLLVGFAGLAVTGHEHWFLALPLAIALPWLFVATPERCQPGLEPPHDTPSR